MHAGWSIWSSTTFCWHDTPICAIVYHSHTKVQFLTWHQQNSECPRPGRVTLRFITNFCWHQKERCVLVLGVYTVTELLFGCQQKLGINLTGSPCSLLLLIAGVRRASDGGLHDPKESHDEEITGGGQRRQRWVKRERETETISSSHSIAFPFIRPVIGLYLLWNKEPIEQNNFPDSLIFNLKLIQGDPSPCGPGLDWLWFGMFHRPLGSTAAVMLPKQDSGTSKI